ncbi:hypothetical protein VTO73DRAFT_9548 [Trametes versicolor]
MPVELAADLPSPLCPSLAASRSSSQVRPVKLERIGAVTL